MNARKKFTIITSTIIAFLLIDVIYLKSQSLKFKDVGDIFNYEIVKFLGISDKYVYAHHRVKGTDKSYRGILFLKNPILIKYEVMYAEESSGNSSSVKTKQLVYDITLSENIFGKIVEHCEALKLE